MAGQLALRFVGLAGIRIHRAIHTRALMASKVFGLLKFPLAVRAAFHSLGIGEQTWGLRIVLRRGFLLARDMHLMHVLFEGEYSRSIRRATWRNR